MKASLRAIARKDAELADERTKLLDALTNLTERNEMLLVEQQKLKDKHEGEKGVQYAQCAVLEEQNGLLREILEDKQDEIAQLEYKIARMEAREAGENFITSRFSCLHSFLVLGLATKKYHLCNIYQYQWLNSHLKHFAVTWGCYLVREGVVLIWLDVLYIVQQIVSWVKGNESRSTWVFRLLIQ